MTEVEQPTPQDEGRFHHYTGKAIPWLLHLLWVTFWSFAAYYILVFLVPAMRTELLSPP